MMTEKKYRTLIKAVSESAKQRFASDEALNRGYLRWEGSDGVPHTLPLFQCCLGLELQQDCYLSESRLEGL